ncbi:hypothetical protein QEJ31_08515 [Pigmentibacter sp. JX0631]|uniref:hypothetical protein n=1 Tax=Pigmentibacter sp. JX0631 TaxID=2976982 RepID=UPI002468C109|nr:hypothetical protein [Pigmentibacter sp. JX0631]WGL58578.1 hypothetical protein QEJ31_08515 [Pigmentibacter sp. JX0631]
MKYIKIFVIINLFLFTKINAEEYFIPKLNSEPFFYTLQDETNLKNDKQLNFIYRDLFDLHFNTWKTEFQRHTEEIKEKYNNLDNDIKNENDKIIEEEIKNEIIKLNEVINEKNNSQTYAEACFKLALYSYMNKQIDAEKARYLIDDGLKELKSYKENTKLYIRMNLLAGDLSILKENFSEAKNYFINIVTKDIDKNEFREDIIRAYIGLGDSEFETFHFQEAKAAYSKGLEFSQNFISYSEDKYSLLLAEIKLRLIWSSYRNAEYDLAFNYVQEFSREKGRYENLISKKVMDDVVRVGALSLFESKKKENYLKISKDRSAGDFGKKIIISSFYYFTAAGYPNEVENMAKEIEREFYASRLLPEFIKSRLVALAKAENINRYNELAYFGTAFIAKDSLWKSRFELSEAEELNRREMVENLSLQAGQYYYNLGISTKSRNEFLKSAQIYHSRIIEHFPEDLRGVLFQSYGNALFMSKDYPAAWLATEESLKHPLDEFSLKLSWFQLVNIAKEQSSEVTDTKTIEFEKYEKAVDGFIAHFPLYSIARNFLFEYAKRCEILGDYENSKLKYEKILSLPSLENIEQAQEEKDRVSLNLANLLKKMSAENSNIIAGAGSLEKIAKEYSVSSEVMSVVKITNYSLAIEYAKNLKEKGELYNSAKFLELWGKNYQTNEQAGEALELSIKEYASLQKWEQVNYVSSYFILNRKDDLRIHEVMFWKARAIDALLQFSSAAKFYILCSNSNSNIPDLNTKKYALNRAVEILQMVKEDDLVPELLEKLANFEKLSNEKNKNYEVTEMESAYNYLKEKKYVVANKIFKNIIARKKINNLMQVDANIGLLTSNLFISNSRISSENAFDKYIKDTVLKIDDSYSRNFYLKKSILFLNDFDYTNFLKENEKNFDKYNYQTILAMGKNKQFVENRIKYIEKVNNVDDILTKTYITYGKMNLKLSDSYALLYKFYDKKDLYLTENDKLRTEGKKYLYLSLSYIKEKVSNEDNLELSALISRFDKRRFTVNVPASIADKQDFFDILEYLPSAMSLNSKIEIGRL